jgi:hypothetical protein
MKIQGYDLVGDIYGHADALHRLLHKLDYAEVEGVFPLPYSVTLAIPGGCEAFQGKTRQSGVALGVSDRITEWSGGADADKGSQSNAD